MDNDQPMNTPHPASFLDHVPQPLGFGTSGLRGLVTDITDLEAFINVKGALRQLLAGGDIRPGSTVVVAGDLRPSTPRILRAAAAAIDDLGLAIEYAGHIPTPALAAYAMSRRCASVMVTGSHIPFDRNGIKLNKSAGEVLKSDEAGIIAEIGRVRVEQYGLSERSSKFDAAGMLKRAAELPPLSRAAENCYIERYQNCFSPRSLAGLRVLVYEHSAVGRDLLAHLLRSLGATVETAGRSESFIPIDTENVTGEQLEQLRQLAIAATTSGEGPHVIVSTDGDSDRPLVAAVSTATSGSKVESLVHFLPGDLLGLVTADFLGVDAVAIPISSNDAVERGLLARGVQVRKTRIGSPYVVAALESWRDSGEALRIAGWEANGGFLTGSALTIGNAILPALLTRDAVLPILANLSAARQHGFDLRGLWNGLPARYGCSGLLDDFPRSASQALMAQLMPAGTYTEVTFDDCDRFPEPAGETARIEHLDAAARASWQEKKTLLEQYFKPEDGFADVVRLNVLDGVRVYFRNGDVAHLRPSGNAPQMRVYANSDSQARADRIVELALGVVHLAAE